MGIGRGPESFEMDGITCSMVSGLYDNTSYRYYAVLSIVE